MDQFSSVLCQAGHLMLLDCRSQEPKMAPMTDSSVTVLIINTNVKHRRRICRTPRSVRSRRQSSRCALAPQCQLCHAGGQ
jgi:galactokinase